MTTLKLRHGFSDDDASFRTTHTSHDLINKHNLGSLSHSIRTKGEEGEQTSTAAQPWRQLAAAATLLFFPILSLSISVSAPTAAAAASTMCDQNQELTSQKREELSSELSCN